MQAITNSELRSARAPAGDGLARKFGALIAKLWPGSRADTRRHMRVIETLAIGPRKQLMLVSCDGERFLVGAGAESVQTIVRLRSSETADESPTMERELS